MLLSSLPHATLRSHCICLKTQQPHNFQSKLVAAQDTATFWSAFANTSSATGSSHMSELHCFSARRSHNPRQIRGQAAAKVVGAKGSTDRLPSSTSFARHPCKKRSSSVPHAAPRKSESWLWVRGQGRYSEGERVSGSCETRQVPETLSQSMSPG